MDKERFKIIKAIFSSLNIIRLVIINCIFFAILILMMAGIASASNGSKNKNQVLRQLNEDTVLLVQPSGLIIENDVPQRATRQFLSYADNFTPLPKIIQSIKKAANDRRITALIFDFSKIGSMSLSSAYEIKAAIDEFTASGKKYYAFSTQYNLASYLLAAPSQRLCIDPFGDIDFSGLAAQGTFFGGMEEKTGIKYRVSKAGTYKGAADAYTEKAFTKEVRENYTALLSKCWDYFTTSCSKDLKIPEGVISSYAESPLKALTEANGDNTKALLNLQLVSDVMDYDSFLNALNISPDQLLNFKRFYESFDTARSKNIISVINLDGAITSSTAYSYNENANDAVLIAKFEKACRDPHVRGIILRINSGGGEVFASEKIRRAVEKARTEYRIPVVVSMGSVAASGAYWIASSADYIFANPFTMTGSIGVLAAFPSVGGALEKYLGISSDMVYAGAKPLSVLQDPGPEEMEILQLEISHIYDTFLQTVSTGRNMDKTKVAEIASGKVYSGEQALDIGLVDKIGSFQDAITYTAELCKLGNDYEVKTVMDEKTFLDELLSFAYDVRVNIRELPFLQSLLDITTLSSANKFLLYTPLRVF